MTARTPWPPGHISCLGLRQLPTQDCQQCVYSSECQQLSSRTKQVKLDDVVFAITPEKLAPNRGYESIEDIQDTYRLCYLTVYGRGPHDHIGRVADAAKRLDDLATELGCSQRLFILAVMTSAHATGPDQPFYANMLFGPNAISRFEALREECRLKFGQFDYKALDLAKPAAMMTRFLHSEELFGSFVVHSVDVVEGAFSLTDFYLDQETAFDYSWLAIEASYLEAILTPHVAGTLFKTAEKGRWRSTVIQARRTLLKNTAMARATFALRESTMAKATELVLRRYHLTPGDLLFASCFTDPLAYWVAVGQAVRQVKLLRYLGDI